MGSRFPLLFIPVSLALPFTLQAETFSIKEIGYDQVEEFVSEVIDFEHGLIRYPSVTFGERFAGQTIASKHDHFLDWHDVLENATPDSPLTAVKGESNNDLIVDFDGHWRSMALFPVGPSIGPYPDRNVGRGTLAMRFDPPICFLGFRTAIDGMTQYTNVNETILRGKPQGSLTIRFYDEKGQELASFMRSRNREGPIAIAYMQSGQADAQIAGVLLEGLDFEGFSVDDIRFDLYCPFKLF